MSQKDPTDFDPKHRILGAVIVVSLAVIFVPMILNRHSAPPSGAAQIPPGPAEPETKIVVTPITPRAPAAPAPQYAVSREPVPASPPVAKQAAAAVAAPVHESAVPKPAATPKPAPVKVSAKPTESRPADIKAGWVVQVGTFSNTANASRLEEQLKKHGHPVSVERVNLASGKASRLRVGPFRDKAQAVKAQGQIQKETGVQGVVLAYP